MSSPQELILHIAADVEISDIEDILRIKSEPVSNYYDHIATAAIGQVLLIFGKPFWKSDNMDIPVPFKFRIEFDCQWRWVRSREILVMQLCKELHTRFRGYYVVSRDHAPIEFWTAGEGFIFNEAERNYHDRYPHNFRSCAFMETPFDH
ncbi:hypothetical protein ACO0LL_27705 [Undibacterium sp. TC4M20W]|uniref:hypothetical protein n=1 Tax=Undibacterium sp. TC4M20W TaxID=3413052 RepID=UPI003BF21DAD